MENYFIEGYYPDGDKKMYRTKWVELIQEEETNFASHDLDFSRNRTNFIKGQEIALKHPQTGATIRCSDDGSIELFANEDAGIIITKSGEVTIIGNKINITSKEMDIESGQYGLRLNQEEIRPERDTKKRVRKRLFSDERKESLIKSGVRVRSR
ncbi:MAG: hypothetical protein ACRC5C_09540 [Bacilli bacterium]